MRLGSLVALLSLLLLVGATLSLSVGPSGLSVGEMAAGLFGWGGKAEEIIMQELRLPRTALAILIGGGLGLTGAALQGFLRNPLAEPAIFGISGAAALGAVLAFYTGFSQLFALALPLSGLAGAALASILLLVLAGRQASTLGLVLSGVAISALAAALTSLALNLMPSPFAVYEIVFWMLGSITDRSLEHVLLAAPFILVGGLFLLLLGPTLNALTLGEDSATSMGARLSLARLLLVAGAALVVGAATAVSGAIGFVGLVVPHLLRPLVGHLPGRLLPVSALGGAVLLLFADLTVRLLPTEQEVKLGVVTALIGTPFFLRLVLQIRRQAA
ncbi:MAG: iron ABC transporter permease [Rhodospirillales bacterium]